MPPIVFDNWWTDVVSALDRGRTIRNWTPFNGYAIGGSFIAISYRMIDDDFKRKLPGLLRDNPENWIVCSQVQARGLAYASKQEFQDRYFRWWDFRINGTTRQAFGDNKPTSPYVISIFKEFDYLYGV
jgi:hypothetical protein